MPSKNQITPATKRMPHVPMEMLASELLDDAAFVPHGLNPGEWVSIRHDRFDALVRAAAQAASLRAERWAIVNALEAFVDGLGEAPSATPGGAWARCTIARIRSGDQDVSPESCDDGDVDAMLNSWRSLNDAPHSFEEHCLLQVAKLAILTQHFSFEEEVVRRAGAIADIVLSEKRAEAVPFVRLLETLGCARPTTRRSSKRAA